MLNNIDFIIDIVLFLISFIITVFMFIKNHNNKSTGMIITIIFAIKIIVKFFINK